MAAWRGEKRGCQGKGSEGQQARRGHEKKKGRAGGSPLPRAPTHSKRHCQGKGLGSPRRAGHGKGKGDAESGVVAAQCVGVSGGGATGGRGVPRVSHLVHAQAHTGAPHTRGGSIASGVPSAGAAGGVLRQQRERAGGLQGWQRRRRLQGAQGRKVGVVVEGGARDGVSDVGELDGAERGGA